MSELLTRLTTPFLPAETRVRLRQQRLDAESALAVTDVLSWTGVSVSVVDAVTAEPSAAIVGRVPGRGIRLLPEHRYTWRDIPKWYRYGELSWDGESLSVRGAHGFRSWPVHPGGIEAGFRADEIAAAGRRPVTSGECPEAVAEIAGVAVKGFPMRRVYFLDAESRCLTMVPGLGLEEADVRGLAERAGVDFRLYSIRTGGSTGAENVCDVVFPRSARYWRALGFDDEASNWWFPGWPNGAR